MMNCVAYMEMREREVRGQKRLVRVMHFNKTPTYYAKIGFKMPDGSPIFASPRSQRTKPV